MLTQWLKIIDASLTPAACFVGSKIPLAFGPRDRAAGQNRVLIVRPGGMGDLICAQIALEELGIDPKSVDWLIEKRSKTWAQFQGLSYFCYDSKTASTFKRLLRTYGTVINTEQRFGLSQAYALACLRGNGKLVSLESNRASQWSDLVIRYDEDRMHEVAAFKLLFSQALSPNPETASTRSLKDPTWRARGKVVGIAGRQCPTRRLSLQTWKNLMVPWANGEPVRIVCAPQDRDFADALAETLAEDLEVAGMVSENFEKVVAAIQSADRFLTIDGGMVHIASYYQVPTDAIFTSGRAGKWAPLAEGSTLIKRQDLPCQPCTLYGQTPPCPHALECHRLSWPQDRRSLV